MSAGLFALIWGATIIAACLAHARHHYRHNVPLESYDMKGDKR